MVTLGEVKIINDNDLQNILNLCNDDLGWELDFHKKNIKVLTKKTDLCSFAMIKAKIDFDDVSAQTFFDVMLDTQYRVSWDEYMIEGYDFCYVNGNSDIGYYCAKSPKPLKNRDLVLQRTWLDSVGSGSDKVIMNHSINHAKIPTHPKRVRGITYLAAVYIKAISAKSCSLTYITQSDPGGSIPSWIVNKVTKAVTPKFVKKMHKACLAYDKWKSKQAKPYLEPWKNPEDVLIPRLDKNDIMSLDLNGLRSVEDESQINEKDFELDD